MSRRKDAKSESLRESGALNPRPQLVTDPLFLGHEFFDARDLVQVKYEMLRRVQIDGLSISEAARAFGFSRPSFYQAQVQFEQRGLPGLIRRRRDVVVSDSAIATAGADCPCGVCFSVV